MAEDWTYSSAVLTKAHDYIAKGAVYADEAEGVFWVQGSGRRRYRVQTDARDGRVSWVTCTCPHGMNTGGGAARCSHAVCGLIAVRDGLTLPRLPRAAQSGGDER